MNKVQAFKNKEFGEIRTVYEKENDQVWFVARDLSKQLGYKSIERMYDHVDKEDKKEINPQAKIYQKLGVNDIPLEPNPNIYRMVLINERGALTAIQGADTSLIVKNKILKIIGMKDKFILKSRPEVEFGEQLTLFVKQLGYSLETQYSVLDYYIDFYIPELNIAIEYDEDSHKYQQIEDRKRELEIQKEIGCKFARIEDGLNIGTQLGTIVKTIMEEI